MVVQGNWNWTNEAHGQDGSGPSEMIVIYLFYFKNFVYIHKKVGWQAGVKDFVGEGCNFELDPRCHR